MITSTISISMSEKAPNRGRLRGTMMTALLHEIRGSL
jgi:hypothetical protein